MKRASGIAAFVAVLLATSSASAQFFSPGRLSRAHASLEGLEKCSNCHEAQKGLSARLCLDCHTELQARIVKNAGFHGHLAPAKRQDCQGCHPDHRGLDFNMVEWDGGRDKFDHQKAGWPRTRKRAATIATNRA
jgi:ribosomal protein L32